VSNKKKIKKPRERGYIKKAIQLGLAAGPGYRDLYVFHDDWCNILTGKSLACNCYPDVRLGPPPGARQEVN
jgi:hypothetical protein